MTTPRSIPPVAMALVCVLALAAPVRAQQDTLARAKTLYASAAYEEALQALATSGAPAPAEAREIAAYQFFCLVALGRNDEAKHAIEVIVKTDPLYHPSESQVSPRVRAFFEDIRRPLLPDVARESYEKAKDRFEKKDMPAAAAEFDRVIALIDEMGPSDGGSDMRTLAAGFRDLAKAAAPPSPPPAPAPAPAIEPARMDVTAPAPPSKAAMTTADFSRAFGPEDADVARPMAVARTMPPWNPANAFEAKQIFRGTMELLIDESGRVASATMIRAVRPTYDPLLLKAARDWKFKPATKNGVPVKYIYRMDVQIGR
jgi:tetratricopeptide (TPR) repeat protein